MKKKKILIIILLGILISIIGVFLYLFIYSSMYKLECSRPEEIIVDTYSFEFNVFKKIVDIEKKAYLETDSKEEAIEKQKEYKKEGENVELDEKTLVFTSKDINYDFSENLKEAKEKCTSWGYQCRMVKK